MMKTIHTNYIKNQKLRFRKIFNIICTFVTMITVSVISANVFADNPAQDPDQPNIPACDITITVPELDLEMTSGKIFAPRKTFTIGKGTWKCDICNKKGEAISSSTSVGGDYGTNANEAIKEYSGSLVWNASCNNGSKKSDPKEYYFTVAKFFRNGSYEFGIAKTFGVKKEEVTICSKDIPMDFTYKANKSTDAGSCTWKIENPIACSLNGGVDIKSEDTSWFFKGGGFFAYALAYGFIASDDYKTLEATCRSDGKSDPVGSITMSIKDFLSKTNLPIDGNITLNIPMIVSSPKAISQKTFFPIKYKMQDVSSGEKSDVKVSATIIFRSSNDKKNEKEDNHAYGAFLFDQEHKATWTDTPSKQDKDFK